MNGYEMGICKSWVLGAEGRTRVGFVRDRWREKWVRSCKGRERKGDAERVGE